VYWLLEGSLASVTGSTATVLVVGRAAFLALQVWIHARIGRMLGAGRAISILLALALAWSVPALEIWTLGGPAEAFGNTFALTCAFLVLRARTPGAVLVTAAIGLAAALTKESSGASTAAALGALAISELLGARRGVVCGIAAAGALVQLAPAAVATLGPRQFSASYLAQVVSAVSAGPGVVFRVALAQGSLAIVLGLAGLVLVLRRLVHTRLRAWPLEDLVVLAVLSAELGAVFGLGLVMSRYHLPLGTALLLVAARGAREIAPGRRAVVIAVVLAAAVLPGGVRAALAARSSAANRRAEARLRAQIADALSRYGAVRIFWLPHDVEQPVGAITHLRADGSAAGEIELKPCARMHPASAQHLSTIFAPYSTPVSKPAPVIAGGTCPGAPRGTRVHERACGLALPSIGNATLRLDCRDVGDLAQVAYRP
jgi:hypothetical protein